MSLNYDEIKEKTELEEIEKQKRCGEQRIQRINRYKKTLRPDIPLYSDNMGLRQMKHLERDMQYLSLNDYIRNIHEYSHDCKDYEELYRKMQYMCTDRKTDWNEEAFKELQARCSNIRERWNIHPHNSSGEYWQQIEIGIKDFLYSISRIKVYVTTKSNKVKELFIGSVEKLIREGQDGFIAMISTVERDGNLCFFVNHNEFLLLEEYMRKHESEIRKGNPLLAYRGLLGISRDLMDLDSYNAQQAKLLWDYFQVVKSKDDIDLEEMYRLFVSGWNGDLPEDNIFYKDFADATAQMFVLMMDSLDVILGRKNIDDNSLLLNDDPKVWDMLAGARCWYDVAPRLYYQ